LGFNSANQQSIAPLPHSVLASKADDLRWQSPAEGGFGLRSVGNLYSMPYRRGALTLRKSTDSPTFTYIYPPLGGVGKVNSLPYRRRPRAFANPQILRLLIVSILRKEVSESFTGCFAGPWRHHDNSLEWLTLTKHGMKFATNRARIFGNIGLLGLCSPT
jgi:hypothetical protein